MNRRTGFEVILLIKRSITSVHLLTTLSLTFPPHTKPPMPKIRDSGQKPDMFEIVTTQTRRGKRVAHVPVKDSTPLSSPSRSVSPTKKRAWSPGVHQPDNDNDVVADPISKRSRTAGKVRTTFDVI
jgi:hypothetical protein